MLSLAQAAKPSNKVRRGTSTVQTFSKAVVFQPLLSKCRSPSSLKLSDVSHD